MCFASLSLPRSPHNVNPHSIYYTTVHMPGRVHPATKHRWDCDKAKWMTSRTSVEIGGKIGQGGMRAAYDCMEDSVASVIKFSTIHRDRATQRDACLRDTRAQSVSEYYSQLFNKKNVPVKISFIGSDTLELDDGRWANVEPKLGGRYVKHNDNAGGVASRDPTSQAFSHFTYEESHHSLLICDIQGVGGMYTDPQILSTAQAQTRFGDGDLGERGIQAFFRSHRCNDTCRAAGLQPNALQRNSTNAATQMPHNANMGVMGMPGFGGMCELEQLFREMRMGRSGAAFRDGLQGSGGARGGGGGGGGRVLGGRAGAADNPRAAVLERNAMEQAQRAAAREHQRQEDADLAAALAASSAEHRRGGGGSVSARQASQPRGGGGRGGMSQKELDEEYARALAHEEWGRS